MTALYRADCFGSRMLGRVRTDQNSFVRHGRKEKKCIKWIQRGRLESGIRQKVIKARNRGIGIQRLMRGASGKVERWREGGKGRIGPQLVCQVYSLPASAWVGREVFAGRQVALFASLEWVVGMGER